MDAKDFLMVGDSWGLGMKKYFPTNTSIISSGLFTRGGLPSAADQIRNSNYSNGVIIVHSGGNDIGMRGPKKNGKSLVTDEVKQTINAAKAKGCKIIFVAAPWLNHANPKFTGSNRDKYNSWLREAALANGAGYIDTTPMLSYMQQHLPKRGNFHLNNYSGYANYILKEAQKMSSANIKPTYNTSVTQSTRQKGNKPKRINNFGGYPAWGKMYTDVQDLLLDHKVNMNIVNQIIQACRNNGLSLNQTAVILGNAFQESRFRTNAKNNVKGGHHGVWQFSTAQYNRFGLSDWGKQLRYLMEEVAKTPEYLLTDKQGKIKKWLSPHIGGNGWKGGHKAVWDTSNDIAKLSWAFGEGWERYGNPKADTDSRTLVSKLFQQYLINTNFGTTAYTPKVLNDTTPQLNTTSSPQTDEEIYADLDKLINENTSLNNDMTQELSNEDMFANLSGDDLFNLGNNFNTSYLNSYANSTYTPGSTYIDYYSPYKNYVHSNPISFLTGGTMLPLYLILDTNNQKSYLILPAGPFKLPRKVLDYEKIIKTLFANQDKPHENILTSIYKDSLQD